MAANVLFYYFGDDEAYFRALQGEFGRHTRIPIKFRRFYDSSESKIQSFFFKIYQDAPAVVFIDFSKQTQDYLHLARLISRTPLEHKVVTVGLVDYLSPFEVLAESNATGVDFTHIKSPETFDVVFDVIKLMTPNEAGEHGFASIQLKDEWEAGVPAKVGYIHFGGIHVESNFQLDKGARFQIKHAWQEKLVPSADVFVSNFSCENLYYHFNRSYDLDFLFIDEFVMTEGMTTEEIKSKQAEHEEQVKKHKKLLRKWIEDNLSRSFEKKGKMLVIDRELLFYKDQARSDKHPYIIRAIPYLNEVNAEMDRTRPQVIAYALEKPEVRNPRNHQQGLMALVEAIKIKYKDLNPFIIVFNSPISSKEMQEVLGYTNVMATGSELSVEVLVKMADLYEKKRGVKIDPPADRVFLKKTDPSSIIEFKITVKVIKISETDVFFTCDRPLTPGMNIHLSKPVDMYVNVQPSKNQSDPPVFHGLIHCLGEVQKKELRRFVNSVFFREHDAALQVEAEDFKQLNDIKLQEKLAEVARIQLEKLAALEEENEKNELKAPVSIPESEKS